MTRSGFVGGMFAVVALAVGSAWVGAAGLPSAVAPAAAQDVTPRTLSSFEEELMKPGPMAEMSLGSPDAPITIIEYASLTCGHCANFHATTYPVLKSEYIDTGKVHFILREFPLDPLAAAGFMLARNAPGDRYFDVVDLMFERQRDWAYSDNPVEALRNLSKQFGYSPQTFEDTLKNQELLDNINAVRARGSEEFKVESTPTFFINGELVRGALPPEEMTAKLDEILDAASN